MEVSELTGHITCTVCPQSKMTQATFVHRHTVYVIISYNKQPRDQTSAASV